MRLINWRKPRVDGDFTHRSALLGASREPHDDRPDAAVAKWMARLIRRIVSDDLGLIFDTNPNVEIVSYRLTRQPQHGTAEMSIFGDGRLVTELPARWLGARPLAYGKFCGRLSAAELQALCACLLNSGLPRFNALEHGDEREQLVRRRVEAKLSVADRRDAERAEIQLSLRVAAVDRHHADHAQAYIADATLLGVQLEAAMYPEWLSTVRLAEAEHALRVLLTHPSLVRA